MKLKFHLNPKLISNQQKKTLILILILTVLIELSVLKFLQDGPTQVRNSILTPEVIEKYVDTISNKCQDAAYKPSCYDENIPLLTDKLTLEQTFQVVRQVVDNDPNYVYCHVLGHEISARETKKDPTRWQEVVARCPSGICSNGCIHGAFQERFRTESLPDSEIGKLKPELQDICEERENWHPTGLEQASCYHALGHLNMYVTDANIDKSLSLCEEIANKQDGRDFSQLCFDGAFMQIYQPLEPEDFALVEGKQPTAGEQSSYCAKFTGKQKGSCWSEGWPLFREQIKNPVGLVKFCDYLTDEIERTRCYTSMLYVLTPLLDFKSEKIKMYCNQLPNSRQGQCFANAASRMIETDWRMIDKSVDLCNQAESLKVGDECYKELLLYSSFNFHLNSEAFYKLCYRLPQIWQDKCLLQNSGKS